MKNIEFYLVNRKHLKDLIFHKQFIQSKTHQPFCTYKNLHLKEYNSIKLNLENKYNRYVYNVCTSLAKILNFYILSKNINYCERIYYYKNLKSNKPIKKLTLHIKTKHIKILDSKIDFEAMDRMLIESSVKESLRGGKHLIVSNLPSSYRENFVQNKLLYKDNLIVCQMFEGIFSSRFTNSLRSITPINFGELLEENNISTEEPIIYVKICLD